MQAWLVNHEHFNSRPPKTTQLLIPVYAVPLVDSLLGSGTDTIGTGDASQADTGGPYGIVVLPQSGDMLWSSSTNHVVQRLSFATNQVKCCLKYTCCV